MHTHTYTLNYGKRKGYILKSGQSTLRAVALYVWLSSIYIYISELP